MKKYITPELTYKNFAMESILTNSAVVSDGSTDEDAANTLKGQLNITNTSIVDWETK